jgi:hypothetical protein
MAKPPSKQLVVCIDNEGYAASLEKRKIYVALRAFQESRRGTDHTVEPVCLKKGVASESRAFV